MEQKSLLRRPRPLYPVFLVCVLVFITVFLYAGRFLLIDDKPYKSDIIVVLAGDRGTRVKTGAALYHEGFAPYLMVSGGTIYHKTIIGELMAEHAQELGVPKSAVILELRADSTVENALFTKELLLKRGFKSAIIVSSSYHMRRVKTIFEREFKNSGISLSYCSAQEEFFNPYRWWSNNKSIMVIINEYIKLLGYFITAP